MKEKTYTVISVNETIFKTKDVSAFRLVVGQMNKSGIVISMIIAENEEK